MAVAGSLSRALGARAEVSLGGPRRHGDLGVRGGVLRETLDSGRGGPVEDPVSMEKFKAKI